MRRQREKSPQMRMRTTTMTKMTRKVKRRMRERIVAMKRN
jgi:hypothetical protein